MLVIRKELKVGLSIGAAVVGVALVYGLMSLLTSSESETNELTAGATDETISIPTDPGLEGAISGLPPVEDGASAGTNQPAAPQEQVASAGQTDPFAETNRVDGSVVDPWTAAFNTGRVSTGGPIITQTPDATNNVAFSDNASGNRSTEAPSSNSTPPAPATGNQPAVPAAQAGTYVVAPGDTFSSIAGKVYGDRNLYHYIVNANPNVDPRKLKPGMELVVPAASSVKNERGAIRTANASNATGAIDTRREYRIQPGDTLHKISQRLYGRTNRWAAIYDLNREKIGPDAGRLKVGTVLTLPEAPTR